MPNFSGSFNDNNFNEKEMLTSFRGELETMEANLKDTSSQARQLSKDLNGGLKKAFEGLIFDGKKLGDVLQQVSSDMAKSTYKKAMGDLTSGLSNLVVSGVNSFVGTSLSASSGNKFSKGGVVQGPTKFPIGNSIGLMGEAGPEAILPLTRGSNGQLGVQSTGGRAVNVVMNIHTENAEGFQRSSSQIATELSRAIQRGQKNL